MLDLASAKTDGHHALSWTPGVGDMRDCVTVYIRSDPHQPADYRLVFREITYDAGRVGSAGAAGDQTSSRAEQHLRACLCSPDPPSGRPAAWPRPVRRLARCERRSRGPTGGARREACDRSCLAGTATSVVTAHHRRSARCSDGGCRGPGGPPAPARDHGVGAERVPANGTSCIWDGRPGARLGAGAPSGQAADRFRSSAGWSA
jgi:hypothetical protein